MKIPFTQVYNHVVAHNIRRLVIRTSTDKYTPSGAVREHINQKMREKPLKVDGVVWKLWFTSMDWVSGTFTAKIGTCRYSEFLHTSCDPELRKMVPDSREWANIAALGALVVTSDNKVVFTRRPHDALLSPGRIDMANGHPTGLEKIPSNESLPEALGIVIKKEFGEVTVASYKPLVVILEEPKLGHDIVFAVALKETLEQTRKFGKVAVVIENSPEAISKFLRTQSNCARPVHLSLAYYGRQAFGEQWFINHCYDNK